MYKSLILFSAILAIAYSAPVEKVFKELPCLGKVAGQRLPHPTNPHQFLRCVTADSVWIETCPDNLFYNPHLQLCDWDQEDKSTTTPTPEVIKTRPVLVKFRPVLGDSLEQTVIEDPIQIQMASSHVLTSDLLTTRASTVVVSKPTEERFVQPTIVQATTPRTEIQFELPTIKPTTPFLEVVQTTTPRAEIQFELPTIKPTTPFLEVVQTTTPRAEIQFELPTIKPTTPVLEVVQTTPAVQIAFDVDQTPLTLPTVPTTTRSLQIEFGVSTPFVPISQQQQPVLDVVSTTPALPVILGDTTTLPVVVMSTERTVIGGAF